MRFAKFILGVAGVSLCIAASAQNARFSDGLLNNITPKGWIKEYLDRQCTGLSGHPEALAFPYDTDLWKGTISSTVNHGKLWWRYEQTAYYSDGLIRLGYALDRKDYVDKIIEGIDYTLENATPEGRLGHESIFQDPDFCLWPQAVFFRAMKAYYDVTKDERIPAALEKFYLLFSPEQVSRRRNIISIEGMMWTYGITGNKALLDLAEKAFALGKFELNASLADAEGCPHLHGVTFCEEMKIPAILYMYTGQEEYRRLAEVFEDKLVHYNMLPSGVPSSAEHVLGNSIDNGHETCDIADFTWSEGYFLEMSGNGAYADKIEKAVFNAAPGAITKDFKAIQYFSNANQFNVTADSNPNPYYYGSTWQAYRPIHQTECCVGNVHRIMPNYVSRMWMRGGKNEIVASLYGPSELELDGVRIEEQTNYPFEGDIRFVFHTDRKAGRVFTFRIPSWCRQASVKVNGKDLKVALRAGEFASIKRSFKDGDYVDLHFEMPARMTCPNGQGISYEKGPLLFSYSIPTKWTVDEKYYDNMRGKKCVNPDFKCWSLTPEGKFNYGVLDLSFEEKKNECSGYPFENPPYSIRIPVREIDWSLVDGKFTPPLPTVKVKKIGKNVEYLDLIPYGCTQLRLTVFPWLE